MTEQFQIQENDIIAACLQSSGDSDEDDEPLRLVGTGGSVNLYHYDRSGYQSCTTSELQTVDTGRSDFRLRTGYTLHLYADIASKCFETPNGLTTNQCSAGNNPPPFSPETLSGTFLNTLSPVQCSDTITAWHYCYYSSATHTNTATMYTATVGVWHPTLPAQYELVSGSRYTVILQPELTFAKIVCKTVQLQETQYVRVTQNDIIGVTLPSQNAIPMVANGATSEYTLQRSTITSSQDTILFSQLTQLLNIALHLYPDIENIPTPPPTTTPSMPTPPLTIPPPTTPPSMTPMYTPTTTQVSTPPTTPSPTTPPPTTPPPINSPTTPSLTTPPSATTSPQTTALSTTLPPTTTPSPTTSPRTPPPSTTPPPTTSPQTTPPSTTPPPTTSPQTTPPSATPPPTTPTESATAENSGNRTTDDMHFKEIDTNNIIIGTLAGAVVLVSILAIILIVVAVFFVKNANKYSLSQPNAVSVSNPTQREFELKEREVRIELKENEAYHNNATLSIRPIVNEAYGNFTPHKNLDEKSAATSSSCIPTNRNLAYMSTTNTQSGVVHVSQDDEIDDSYDYI